MKNIEQTLDSREVAEMVEKDQIKIDVVKKCLTFERAFNIINVCLKVR